MTSAERAEALLQRMTLEEKIAQMDMIRGVTMATRTHPAHFCAVDDASDFDWALAEELIGGKGIGFVHDVYGKPHVLNRLQRYLVEKTRLGIPAIFTGEALHGLACPGAMSFPMPIGLGAAFDPALTEEVGAAIAAETRALGIHEVLAPNLDVARDPRWGRVEETFGEDTFLCRCMARAIIRGEQGESVDAPDKVVAEPKHYLAHGFPEGGLNCASARAGEREILSEYLPVFEAGVREGGAYCAMAAYHSVDGTPLICSRHYLTEILKEQLGLRGYIRADFGAIYRLRHAHHMTDNDSDAIAMAVNTGLDVQGFDYSNEIWQGTLAALVNSGRVPSERIDDAVRRILFVKFEAGLFDHPYTDERRWQKVVRGETHKEICLRAARESMVLLKNDGVLPLCGVRSVAVIGPSSARQRIGSYASVPYGYTVPSVYDELRRLLPAETKIRQEDGCGISERDYRTVPAVWLPGGVLIRYYADGDFKGRCAGSARAGEIRFNWMLAKPHPALPFRGYGARMEGVLRPNADFDGYLLLPSRDSVRLWLDGALVIDSWGANKQKTPAVRFRSAAEASHAFVIEYLNDGDGRDVAFAFSPHSSESMDRAVALAARADVAVLVCGDDTVTSGEGMDRCDLRLYGPQRELVRRVAEAAKKTVLVLEVGKPVDLTAEEPLMNAILLPWFGGELGARAIAEALLGAIDPSGRLPVSFPQNVGCLPCHYTRLPGGSPEYLECSAAPRYPFGYGLSYTRFTLSALSATVAGRNQARAVCTVANAGSRAGTAVLQMYVEDPVSSVVVPDLRLCAFRRVFLDAGESREITFLLGEDAFRLMNARREWTVEPGAFILHLGFSSADIRQSAEVVFQADQ